MAGVYALRRGAARLSDAGRAVWFDTTAGVSYDEFFGRLGERRSLWLRQMVLGPTPEFCSADDDDQPTGAVIVTASARMVPRPLDRLEEYRSGPALPRHPAGGFRTVDASVIPVLLGRVIGENPFELAEGAFHVGVPDGNHSRSRACR